MCISLKISQKNMLHHIEYFLKIMPHGILCFQNIIRISVTNSEVSTTDCVDLKD